MNKIQRYTYEQRLKFWEKHIIKRFSYNEVKNYVLSRKLCPCYANVSKNCVKCVYKKPSNITCIYSVMFNLLPFNMKLDIKAMLYIYIQKIRMGVY